MTRLSPTGKRYARWSRWHEQSRTAVMARADGRCEAGGEWAGDALQWSHLFGRRGIVGEPLCSDPDLTCGLCPSCHRAIDGNRWPTVLLALRMNAIDRYATTHGLSYDLAGEPLGIIRKFEKQQGGPS